MTNQEIITRGELIRDETVTGANTAQRIGEAFVAIGENLEEFENKIGITFATFIFPSTENTYQTMYLEYAFVNGHRYRIHIDDDDTYLTYFSVRDSSDALQNNIGGRSSGTRDIYFTCNVDGGTRWAMTMVEAHDAKSYNCYIVDLDEVSLYAHDERIADLEEDMSEIHAQNLPQVLEVGEAAEERTINFTVADYYVNANGELAENANQTWKVSNVFQLKKNETIRMTASATGSNAPLIILTNEGSTSYIPLVKSSVAQTLEEVSYTATEDCYIILQYYRISGEPIIFADSARLIRIEKELSEYEESTDATISNIERVLELEQHDDVRTITFTKNGTFIKPDGSVGESTYWWQSNVFFLHANEKVTLTCKTTTNGAVVMAIVTTSGNTTTYTPVRFGYGQSEFRQISYTTTEDCYIILQCLNRQGDVVITSDSGRFAQIEADIQAIQDSIDSVLGSQPDYATEEMERVYAELLERMNDDNIFIAFNTDQHFDLDYASREHSYNPKWVLQGVKSLRDIATKIPLDLIVFGGDTAGYGSGTSRTVKGIIQTDNYLFESMVNINVPIVSIPGNHDAYQNNGDITPNAMFNLHYKRFVSLNPTRVHSGEKYDCNSYIDDDVHGVRYIFIDTFSEFVPMTNWEEYQAHIAHITTFLTNSLSEMPQGYNAIVFSHNPLTSEFSAFKKVTRRIVDGVLTDVEVDAFSNPTDLHSVLDTYANNIIACVCGHSHADVYAFSQSGILFIETTCAAAHTRDKYFDENVDNDVPMPYEATINTVTDTAFDFFVINLEDKTIEAIRYGQGSNRKWIYKGENAGLVSYTNNLHGTCSVGSVTITFTNINDESEIITCAVSSDGIYSVYLQLGETYQVSCSGYTIDEVVNVTLTENTEQDLTLTENE